MYWDNIDRDMIDKQASVFRHFGLTIDQYRRHKMQHGDFLDQTMAALGDDDVLLCMDIDCVPLNRAIVDRAFDVAERGGIIGCAQVSMHIDPLRIFTAPCFMALSKRTWIALGRPSFRRDAHGDVGQALHDKALAEGVPIEYLEPWACVIPRWNLAGKVIYGIGTFYRGGVFHLYESRESPYRFVFDAVIDAVLAGRDPDILRLSHHAMRRYLFDYPISRLSRHRRRIGMAWRKLAGGFRDAVEAPGSESGRSA